MFAALIVAACPIAMQMGTTAQPEPLFALLVFCVAVAFQEGRYGRAASALAAAVLLRYEAWACLAVITVIVAADWRHPEKRRGRAWITIVLPVSAIAVWALRSGARSMVDGLASWVRRESSRRASFTKRARFDRETSGTSSTCSTHPLFVPYRVMGSPLAAFSGARTVRQQGPRFVLVLASSLGFITLTWLLRSSLGLDRHFVVVVPLYAIFAAQGANAIGDGAARWLARLRPEPGEAGRMATVGRALGGGLSALSLAGLLVMLGIWMGFWRASLVRGFPRTCGDRKNICEPCPARRGSSATMRRSKSLSGLDRHRFDRHWIDDPHTWDLVSETWRESKCGLRRDMAQKARRTRKRRDPDLPSRRGGRRYGNWGRGHARAAGGPRSGAVVRFPRHDFGPCSRHRPAKRAQRCSGCGACGAYSSPPAGPSSFRSWGECSFRPHWWALPRGFSARFFLPGAEPAQRFALGAADGVRPAAGRGRATCSASLGGDHVSPLAPRLVPGRGRPPRGRDPRHGSRRRHAGGGSDAIIEAFHPNRGGRAQACGFRQSRRFDSDAGVRRVPAAGRGPTRMQMGGAIGLARRAMAGARRNAKDFQDPSRRGDGRGHGRRILHPHLAHGAPSRRDIASRRLRSRRFCRAFSRCRELFGVHLAIFGERNTFHSTAPATRSPRTPAALRRPRDRGVDGRESFSLDDAVGAKHDEAVAGSRMDETRRRRPGTWRGSHAHHHGHRASAGAAPGCGLGILGGGYGAAQLAITGMSWFPGGWRGVELLLLLAVIKGVATCLTVGTGGSAGDFGPSLVIGGIFGGAFGRAAQLLLHDPRIDPGAFALVGMGTFYGGLAHVPIASLVMTCELAGSYDLLVPLMPGDARARGPPPWRGFGGHFRVLGWVCGGVSRRGGVGAAGHLWCWGGVVVRRVGVPASVRRFGRGGGWGGGGGLSTLRTGSSAFSTKPRSRECTNKRRRRV